jgi:predicted nucleic acid-binding protein
MSMLVDTSVWVDHFRHDDHRLKILLLRAQVQSHPFVIGELACGSLRRRSEVLSLLQSLPAVPVASNNEALEFIERNNLMGRGIGWVDVHLLASASFAGIPVWTRDRRLAGVARLLGLYAQPS